MTLNPGTLITEGEILMIDFEIRKVSCAPFPINREAWENSRAGVQREIWRIDYKMTKHYDPDALEEMQKQKDKLYLIINDLNKVLNG